MKDKLLLVGAGGMAESYSEVLMALNVDFDIVCRSGESAMKFRNSVGAVVHKGGVSNYLGMYDIPSHAIVAVGVEHLYSVCKVLIEAGVKSILLEKPGSLFNSELVDLNAIAVAINSTVYIGYNRRFYASVKRLREMAEHDGGLTSISFDFTEWSDRIAPLAKGPEVKDRWVLSNSTHVIDLAFFLAGCPSKISTDVSGSLEWHEAASRFCGSGITNRDVQFNYRADWDAPGRWGVKAYSKNFSYELVPLESLKVTERNSVVCNSVDLEDQIDKEFKPGLYRQVEAFIAGDKTDLCTLEEQLSHFPFYISIAGYGS